MALPARQRCPCGTLVAPRVPPRPGRKSLLSHLQCPVCRLTTPAGRPEDLTRLWNETVDRENQRVGQGGLRRA
jgi:hypothetical protein